MEQQASLPPLLECIAGAWLEADQIDVIDSLEHVLRFVMTGQKSLLLEDSARRHADAGPSAAR
jgi:hypothetical protein